MSHFTIALLIVGAFALVLGAVKAARAYLKNRSEEMAPFRHYFGSEYDRDLLRQSSWCDDESSSELRTRFDAINVRDRGAAERYSSGRDTTRRKRDLD
jgi:hypothetical protein